jgi:hypothetical protein
MMTGDFWVGKCKFAYLMHLPCANTYQFVTREAPSSRVNFVFIEKSAAKKPFKLSIPVTTQMKITRTSTGRKTGTFPVAESDAIGTISSSQGEASADVYGKNGATKISISCSDLTRRTASDGRKVVPEQFVDNGADRDGSRCD